MRRTSILWPHVTAFALVATTALTENCTPVLAGEPSEPLPEIPLLQLTVYGGQGVQYFRELALESDRLYASGTSNGRCAVVRYDLPEEPPADPLEPTWDYRWPGQPSPPDVDVFFGVAATPEAVYLAGRSYWSTNDGSGTKEAKSVLMELPAAGPTGPLEGGANWIERPIFFPGYQGYEGFYSVVLSEEPDGEFLYVAEWAQANSRNSTAILAKYTTSGSLVWTRQLSDTAWERYGYIHSLARIDGNVYAAGVLIFDDAGPGPQPPHAALWSYDSEGNVTWGIEGAMGQFFDLVGVDGGVAAVGIEGPRSGPYDSLVARYTITADQTWETLVEEPGDQRLFCVAVDGRRIFAAGFTESEGSGGKDVLVLEIDLDTGEVLKKTVFGGEHDDVAYAAVVYGSTLYVAGGSASFVTEGGTPGEMDAFIAALDISPRNACGGIEPCGYQLPGDCNQDGSLDVSDAVCTLGHLFLGEPSVLACGEASIPGQGSLALLDVNGDGVLDVSDPVYMLAYLFTGGPAPVLGTECVPIAGCTDACSSRN